MSLRQLAAILFLGTLFFNWVGYRLLNSILQDSASHILEARLDRQQYDKRQLISVKVPVTHLAYYNSSTAFQRTNGEIDIDGIPYHYVSSRLLNDSLEMLCIPNAAALKLRHSDGDYFKLVNDVGQGSKPDTHAHWTKGFTGDPFTCIPLIVMDGPPVTLVKRGYHFITHLRSLTLPTDVPPPISPAA